MASLQADKSTFPRFRLFGFWRRGRPYFWAFSLFPIFVPKWTFDAFALGQAPRSGKLRTKIAWNAGYYGRASGVLDHPDKQRIIVLARGGGYVINPEAPEDVTSFGCGLFQEFHELPDFNAILFVDPLGMETIKKEGRW